MPPLPRCPDRCGGRAEFQAVEASGHARYRCSRCGEVWWTPPPSRDPEEGERLKDRGMALAAGAEEDWSAWARREILRLASHGAGFTADDLMWIAEAAGREPAHRNAIGAAFNAAARAGLIAQTGETRLTDRASGHRRRLLVWRGLP